MKLLMHEVLQKVSNAKTKKEKIALLEKFNTPALRMLFIINFDDSIVSLLPPGKVPYTPNDAPLGTEHTQLEREARLLHHFFKGGSNVSQNKREMMFIQMLEGLHPEEAKIICLVKDKNLTEKYKLTKEIVAEAFPDIAWGLHRGT